MDPASRAFLLTVLRYRTLLARRRRPDELARLRALLAERRRASGRPDYEQRGLRRVPIDAPAYVRVDDLDTPATIEDLSGSGALLRDEGGGRDRLAPGVRGTLHVAPGGTTLRIFLSFSVVRRAAGTGRFGVRFVGAPLVAHQRIAATSAVVAAFERSADLPRAA